MKHISLNGPALAGLTLLLGLGVGGGAAALAETSHSGCYVEDETGQLYDLGALCVVPSGGEPVLQTGDVQVTLRWNTSDDLDLIVVDPAGSIVDFGTPTSPSGGQLDVDANGFCETQEFSPVENIFWPTGEAPNGDYLAYVTLAIPCTLEELASTNATAANAAYETLEVPYTLTILSEGVTTTYDGTSRPEELGVNYPFRVGPSVGSTEETVPETTPPEDELELPNFEPPEL